jgi:hypothetical protein
MKWAAASPFAEKICFWVAPILGGAAVYRCYKPIVLIAGFNP